MELRRSWSLVGETIPRLLRPTLSPIKGIENDEMVIGIADTLIEIMARI